MKSSFWSSIWCTFLLSRGLGIFPLKKNFRWSCTGPGQDLVIQFSFETQTFRSLGRVKFWCVENDTRTLLFPDAAYVLMSESSITICRMSQLRGSEGCLFPIY